MRHVAAAEAGGHPVADTVTAYLEAEGERVEAALEEALGRIAAALPAWAPAVLRHGVLSGGKRLRPILFLTAFREVGGTTGRAAYGMAAAIELIHAYSLMHDDLPSMDDADLRRGRPTPHRVFGVRRTTVAAAALIPGAFLQGWWASGELGCTEDRRRRLLTRLAEAAGAPGMVGGQVLDLLGEDRRLTADELDELHRRKTGALLAASTEMGAVAAGGSEAVIHALRAYGAALGLAFQIADDILDATGSAGELGKNPSDSALAKSTYVTVYGVDEARRRAERAVSKAVGALDEAGLEALRLRELAGFVIARGH